MSSALFAEIGSHRSTFNRSARHKGDQSARFSKFVLGACENWRPKPGDNIRRHSHTAWADSGKAINRQSANYADHVVIFNFEDVRLTGEQRLHNLT